MIITLKSEYRLKKEHLSLAPKCEIASTGIYFCGLQCP
jgi:hypothetical protein